MQKTLVLTRMKLGVQDALERYAKGQKAEARTKVAQLAAELCSANGTSKDQALEPEIKLPERLAVNMGQGQGQH